MSDDKAQGSSCVNGLISPGLLNVDLRHCNALEIFFLTYSISQHSLLHILMLALSQPFLQNTSKNFHILYNEKKVAFSVYKQFLLNAWYKILKRLAGTFRRSQILKLGEVFFAQPGLMGIFQFGRWENGSNEKIMSHDKTITAGHVGHFF